MTERRWHRFTFFESFYCLASEKARFSYPLLRSSCGGMLWDTLKTMKRAWPHRDCGGEGHVATLTENCGCSGCGTTGQLSTDWLRWALRSRLHALSHTRPANELILTGSAWQGRASMTLGMMPLPGLVPRHPHFTRHCFTPSLQRQTSWYFYENSLNLHLPSL